MKGHGLRRFGFRQPISRRMRLVLGAVAVMSLFSLWALADYRGWLPPAFFPGPGRVVLAGRAMFCDQDFLKDVLASGARVGAAFLVSALLAVPLAILMSGWKVLEGLAAPLVDFVRYVPVPALAPLFVLWTGIGETTKFLVLFSGTFFQLLLLVLDDADNVPLIYFDLARTLGARTPQLLRDVLVPYLLPQIYDRLRVTLGWCWTYLVIAELIAVERGVGHAIKEAQRFNGAEQLFVCFVVLGLIGLGTDGLARAGYVRLFPYTVKVRPRAD